MINYITPEIATQDLSGSNFTWNISSKNLLEKADVRCIALQYLHNMGRQTVNVSRTVTVPKKFVIALNVLPNRRQFVIGEIIYINCSADGYPEPTKIVLNINGNIAKTWHKNSSNSSGIMEDAIIKFSYEVSGYMPSTISCFAEQDCTFSTDCHATQSHYIDVLAPVAVQLTVPKAGKMIGNGLVQVPAWSTTYVHCTATGKPIPLQLDLEVDGKVTSFTTIPLNVTFQRPYYDSIETAKHISVYAPNTTVYIRCIAWQKCVTLCDNTCDEQSDCDSCTLLCLNCDSGYCSSHMAVKLLSVDEPITSHDNSYDILFLLAVLATFILLTIPVFIVLICASRLSRRQEVVTLSNKDTWHVYLGLTGRIKQRLRQKYSSPSPPNEESNIIMSSAVVSENNALDDGIVFISTSSPTIKSSSSQPNVLNTTEIVEVANSRKDMCRNSLPTSMLNQSEEMFHL